MAYKKGTRVRKKCPVCSTIFTVKASHAERRKYCSAECRQADTKAGRAARREAEAQQAAVQAITTAKKKHGALTPAASAEIRGQISTYVQGQILLANQVVLGQIEWSPVQARVFSTLLNKVVPDLNASFVQQETVQTDVSKLSRQELEALAAEMKTIDQSATLSPEEDDIVDAVVTQIHDPKEHDQ